MPDEGLYNDGSSVIARPLTTAYGGASPQGEALIRRTATVIASEGVAVAWQSPGREMSPTYPRQPTRRRWLTAAKFTCEAVNS